VRTVPHELYPFESHWLDRDGLRLHYLDEGSGPPVVMVHGNPTWSFYYRDLVKGLSGDHRCIVPDHIGCGHSDKPGDEAYTYTLQSRIDDLGRLIDQAVPTGQLDIVVHDWGGAIGMGWATRNPDRVRRVVVLNTAAFHNPPGKPLPKSLWLARNTGLGALLVQGFNAFSAGATRMAVTRKPLSKAVRDAYTAPYDSWADRIATLRFVQDIPLSDKDPAYAPITRTQEGLAGLTDKPALICWGMKDFVFDAAFLAHWETLWPHATVHRYPESGHYVLEDSADEIIPLIREFLA
jgi:cis-3-alkyl-4-acyloxetan-2-one decarboxylase